MEEILKIYEADNCTAWDLYGDGHYERREPDIDEDKRCAQETFILSLIHISEPTRPC